jgi:hypothetical protein
VYERFVADIVLGRARGVTAERVKQAYGQGGVISAEEAVGLGMADRLFPTTTAAFAYASSYGERQRLRTDLDHIDMFLMMHGEKADRDAARARFVARSAPVVDEAQRQADLDYTSRAIRIAERM